MAGAPANRESGPKGGSVTLDVSFRVYAGGPLVDDDRYFADGTLPVVEIYRPNGEMLLSSTSANAVQPVRTAIGQYEYTFLIPASAQASSEWSIVWKIQINQQVLEFTEYFIVTDPNAPAVGPEFRIGIAFNNPDRSSDEHAPGWGLLFTPDEMRYLNLFGTTIVSPDANQTYDDGMMMYYISAAIALVERDLNWDLIPRLNLHVGLRPGDGSFQRAERTDLQPDDVDYMARMTEDQRGRLVRYERGYAWRKNTAVNGYMRVLLDRRPVQRISKVVMNDPVQFQILDLMPYLIEDLEQGVMQFAFTQVSTQIPIFLSGLTPLRFPFNDLPNAIQADYRSGYANSKDVPHDLREMVRLISGIMILNDFGDGKSPGLASASINLNSISESYSTTQSATNALYGARIIQFQKQLKEMYQRNRFKYGNQMIGVL